MSRHFELTDPGNTLLRQAIEAIEWRNDAEIDPDGLKVAKAIGCIVVPDATGQEPSELLVFSDDVSILDGEQPPAGIIDLSEPTFNGNYTAKGLGIHVANTPEATEMRNQSGISVFSVSLFCKDPIYKRPGSDADNLPIRATRLGRHLALWMYAAGVDRLTSGTLGLYQSMRFMERGDGIAEVAVFPTPPSWRMRQDKQGINHPVIPRGLLVKATNPQTRLKLVGSFPAASLRKA